MLLASATQSAPPQCQQSLSERRETVKVPWYRIVDEVTPHDRLHPLPRLSYGIMHAFLKLLLKLPQFAPHALADRFASHGESKSARSAKRIRIGYKVPRAKSP